MDSDSPREPDDGGGRGSGPSFTVVLLVFYGLMAGLGVLLAWLLDVPSIWRMEPGPPGPISPEFGLLLGIALGLAVHAGSTFVRRRFGWTQKFYEQIRRMLGTPSTVQVVIAASASAIGEEILFRGALMPAIGLVPQAILFGLLHLSPGREFRFWPFYAAAMGLAFGLLYQASGTIMAPILAHFTVNYFGLASLREKPERTSPPS